jgi:hypothetical protein
MSGALEKESPGAGTGTGAQGIVDNPALGEQTIAEPVAASDREGLLSMARRYLQRGLTPVRLAPKSKVPGGKLEANTITSDNALRLLGGADYNIGIRLGAEHGQLVDFDLDWPEARKLGLELLSLFARFGRASAPGSHYLLRCKDLAKSHKFDIPELRGVAGLPEEHAVCVLEVRASGLTMAPPSVHPNGETIVWERESELLEDNAEGVLRRAGLLAVLSVVLRFYPEKGSRDDVCMALSGALLAAGLAPGDADRCIVAVALAAGDEEASKRGKSGPTEAKRENGEPATGIPRLVELLGLPELVGARFRKWLGIKARAETRPEVIYSENRLPETLDAAEAALLASGAQIYQMGGRIVQPIRLDASESADGVQRRAGALLIRDLRPHRLRELMIGAANFVKITSEEEHTPVAPPLSFANSYAAREGVWRLPVLRGVSEAPTLRIDGTVVFEDGYDAASGLIIDKGGTEFPPVPENPTRDEAVAALAKIKALLVGFPFVDEASRSVALSAVLTAVSRRALRTAPLHGFSAPTMGTGKSLLADFVSMVATGRDASVMTQGATEEEDEKRLLSVLLQGDPVVVIDNVLRPVTGDALCSILTSETWQGRPLGQTGLIRVPTQTLFIANGNNLEFREDMSTRAILSVLDAKMERPETRSFTVDLRVEVPRRRGELVAAALTVLRAYVVAARPGASELEPFGRFEEWSALVRGALVWAGEADPCETRAMVSVGDTAKEELTMVVDAWERAIGLGTVVRAADLILRADAMNRGHDEALRTALETACPRGVSAKSVGKYLARMKGRIVRGRRIVMVPDDKAGATYRLEAAG